MYKMSNLAGYNTFSDINITGLSSIDADEINAEEINVTTLTIPRINLALVPLLGGTIDVASTLQNIQADSGGFTIWNQVGSGQLAVFDSTNNNITFNVQTLSINAFVGTNISGTINFTNTTSNYVNSILTLDSNSNITLPRLNPALTPIIGSTVSLRDLVSQINFDTTVKSFDLWLYNGTGTMFSANTQTNNFDISPDILNIFPATGVYIDTTLMDVENCKTKFLNSQVSILNTVSPFVTVPNGSFDTPVQSLNSGTTYTSPYSAITNWTFTVVSGATPTFVAVGRGFFDGNPAGPNSYVFYYPNFPIVNQCIAIRQNAVSSFRLSQNLTINQSGVYIVSFWIWGRYNTYSVTQTVTSSFGSVTYSNVQASEQFWKKVQFLTYVSAGSRTLSITFNQTSAISSAICLTNIQVEYSNGLTIGDTDGGISNNFNIVSSYGSTTNGISNNGQLWNYGDFTLYGAFAPFLQFVKNSAIIGDCKYGSRSTDLGEHNYIFGYGIGTNIKQGGINGNLNRVIAIGSGAVEQAGTLTDSIAIGRLANRYSGSDTSICIGNNAGQYFGYSNRINMSNNICLGHEALGAVFSGNGNQHNIAIGNNAMRTGGDFTNIRGFNTVIGNNAGHSLASSLHSVLGYNSYINNTNIASSNNSVLGSNSANLSTTGQLNQMTFLGANSNVLSATTSYRNSTAVGSHAIIETANSIVLGGLNQSDLVTYPQIVLPSKLTLQSATLYNTATLNLTTGRLQSQNIILESSIVTTINLPSVSPTNVGLTFTILRGYIPVAGNNFTIYTSGGLNIQSARVAPAAAYTVDSTITWITITLVSTTGTINWVVNYTRKTRTVQDGSTASDIPVLFQNAGEDVAELKIDSPAFTYNPSSETLRVSNLTTSNPIYQKQESAITVSGASNVIVDITVGSSSLYRFSNMGAGIVTYRLPTITASTVGWEFRIKRMFGSNMNVCTINPSAFTTQAIIYDGVGPPSTASINIGTGQSMFQLVSTITQLGGFSGTFTNVAGSTTITINTIPAGNIVFMGGILNLNGNVRTITGYGTGRGQNGTYTVNTAIAIANTTASFTASESYGYILCVLN